MTLGAYRNFKGLKGLQVVVLVVGTGVLLNCHMMVVVLVAEVVVIPMPYSRMAVAVPPGIAVMAVLELADRILEWQVMALAAVAAAVALNLVMAPREMDMAVAALASLA